LAHKKKRRVRRVVVVKRRSSYRGRNGPSRRGSTAIPMGQMAVIAMPIVKGFRMGGLSEAGVDQAMYQLTGFSPSQNKLLDYHGLYTAAGLIIMSTIGAKVANKTGVNRLLKKASGGYIKLF
jgi:hypothetical protein